MKKAGSLKVRALRESMLLKREFRPLLKNEPFTQTLVNAYRRVYFGQFDKFCYLFCKMSPDAQRRKLRVILAKKKINLNDLNEGVGDVVPKVESFDRASSGVFLKITDHMRSQNFNRDRFRDLINRSARFDAAKFKRVATVYFLGLVYASGMNPQRVYRLLKLRDWDFEAVEKELKESKVFADEEI